MLAARTGALIALLVISTSTFAAPPVKFGVQVDVTGSGTVTSSPGGISCLTSCLAYFKQGATISLTATPAAGESFLGWGGACSGTGSCVITDIRADVFVSAQFTSDGGGGNTGTPTITQVFFDTISLPGTVNVIGTNLNAITVATFGQQTLSEIGSSSTIFTGQLEWLPEDGDHLLTLANAAGSATWQLTFGAVGPEGPPGEPGADGADGADGLQGQPGPPGAPGADGADGTDGAPGGSCSATQQAAGALISCEDGSTATLADGADGQKGDPGADGAVGPQGAPGLTSPFIGFWADAYQERGSYCFYFTLSNGVAVYNDYNSTQDRYRSLIYSHAGTLQFQSGETGKIGGEEHIIKMFLRLTGLPTTLDQVPKFEDGSYDCKSWNTRLLEEGY